MSLYTELQKAKSEEDVKDAYIKLRPQVTIALLPLILNFYTSNGWVTRIHGLANSDR